jgi:hypothetical protein
MKPGGWISSSNDMMSIVAMTKTIIILETMATNRESLLQGNRDGSKKSTLGKRKKSTFVQDMSVDNMFLADSFVANILCSQRSPVDLW